MSAIKRFYEEVSDVIGHDGEMTAEAVEVGATVLTLIPRGRDFPLESSNERFRELVKKAQEEHDKRR